MNLIEVKDNIPLLKPEVSAQIAEFERKVKEIKSQEESLKEAILKEMEEKGIIRIETLELLITYIAPSDREKFDSKGFKRDFPDIYDDYITMIPVKSSVRVKVRDEK